MLEDGLGGEVGARTRHDYGVDALAPLCVGDAENRITSGLAGELHGTGIRVNAVAARGAVMSERFADLLVDLLGPDAIESIEDIVEAVVAFCDCPKDVTGKVAVSLELIADWGLTVHGLDRHARV